ncbi:unnamed protein product [Sphagnum troendelagicum]|uniref:Uncharacterized protein n=1 Tax=Sphagnum troendelagicum TaxID=128251 RepID=A0ABP0U1H7_9BRYO
MITMEIRDINKQAGHIRIPSVAESVTPKKTTLQKILYSGLLNQCRKCHCVGYFAQTCTIPKVPIRDGNTHVNNFPTWNERVARGPVSIPPNQTAAPIHNNGKKQGRRNKYLKKAMGIIPLEQGTRTGQTPRPFLENPTIKNAKRNSTQGKWKQNTPASNVEDQTMGELVAILTHLPAKNLNAALPKDKGLDEGTDGRNTSKEKLIFDLPRGRDDAAERKWADANPFEALNGEDNAFDFLKKTPKALEGG